MGAPEVASSAAESSAECDKRAAANGPEEVAANTTTSPRPIASPRIGKAGLAMEPEPEDAPGIAAADGAEPEPEPAPEVAEEEESSPEEVYQQLRAACAAINAKLGDTQAELHEHKMVITALEPLPDDRRCFRLLGSVLVEKTKAEVLPQMVEQKTKVRATAELSREGRGRSVIPTAANGATTRTGVIIAPDRRCLNLPAVGEARGELRSAGGPLPRPRPTLAPRLTPIAAARSCWRSRRRCARTLRSMKSATNSQVRPFRFTPTPNPTLAAPPRPALTLCARAVCACSQGRRGRCADPAPKPLRRARVNCQHEPLALHRSRLLPAATTLPAPPALPEAACPGHCRGEHPQRGAQLLVSARGLLAGKPLSAVWPRPLGGSALLGTRRPDGKDDLIAPLKVEPPNPDLLNPR